MLNIFQYRNGLQIIQTSSLLLDTMGELQVLTSDGKIYYHNGTISSPLVTEAGGTTISNKNFVDNSTFIVNNADGTISIGFNVGGTTGTTTTLTTSQTVNRVITFPDASGTLLVSTGGPGVLAGNVLDEASVYFVDHSDNTKALKVDSSTSTTNTSTTLKNSQTANRVLTLPDLTDNLVSRTSTDTLTNKTLTVGSNHITSTAARAAQFASGTGDLEASNVTINELGYLSGATSNIQTQINGLAPAAGTVTLTGSQTLSNKNLVDNSTFIVDNSDATKRIGFDAAGTTGTTTTIQGSQTANRTLTLPDVTDTLVSRTSVDQGANRLKTKDLNDADVVFVDSADPTKKFVIDAGGTTGTIMNLVAAQTSTRTVNLPDASTNLVGDDFAQTITNKDLNGGTASSTNKWAIPKAAKSTLDLLARRQANIFYATDQNKAYIDNGTQLIPVGSGSGTGGVNFIGLDTNFSFLNSDDVDSENSIGNWATYADSPGVAPVDMTGGSATSLTLSRTTTAGEVLNGSASFKIVKTATNAQGMGVSVIGNIPTGYRGSNISIKLPFKIISGSLVSGDLKMYIYDVTNSQVISPFNNDVITGQGILQATFPTSSTTAQIRFGFHFASTSSTAVTFSWDDVLVGPGQIVFSPSMTNTKNDLSFTFTDIGTVTNNSVFYKQDGDRMIVYGYATTGTPTSTVFSINLPAGYIIDTSKMPTTDQKIGSMDRFNNSGGGIPTIDNGPYTLFYDGSTNNKIFASRTTGSQSAYNKGAGTSFFAPSDSLTFQFDVPITGWSTNLVTANSSVFNISNILANGTRVTGSAPTQLGQYRSYLRNGGGATYTETNGSPTTAPSVSNGVLLYQTGGFAAGDSNNSPSKYEIFVGKNKTIEVQPFRNTGKTGYINIDFYTNTGQDSGWITTYDPTTGIVSVSNYPGTASIDPSRIGTDENGLFINANAYFDIRISENVLAVQLGSVSTVWLTTGNGYGSGSTKIRRFSSTISNIGNDITYVDDSTLGATFTINTSGVYTIDRVDRNNSTSFDFGISINSNQLTTSIGGITASNRLTYSQANANNGAYTEIHATVYCSPGDIIRAHDDGTLDGSTSLVMFRITKVI